MIKRRQLLGAGATGLALLPAVSLGLETPLAAGASAPSLAIVDRAALQNPLADLVDSPACRCLAAGELLHSAHLNSLQAGSGLALLSPANQVLLQELLRFEQGYRLVDESRLLSASPTAWAPDARLLQVLPV